LTEHEYEAWFDKYLGSVETLDKIDIGKSPLSRIPKPLNRKAWEIIAVMGLIVSLAVSCLLAWLYEITCLWLLNWFNNAFLSLSVGIAASLIIMIYTNAKERNVAFYSDIIPILENRHENMHKAYFDFYFKISIYSRAQKYTECYHAWHANCNACFVILEFLRYLYAVLPFSPKSLTFTLGDIEKATETLSEANEKISKEFFDKNSICQETIDLSYEAISCGAECLYNIEDLIQEFKCNLYGIKYGKTARAVEKINEED